MRGGSSMDCAECRVQLPLMVDGELDAPEYTEVEAHLEGCHGCAVEHARLIGLKERMRESAVLRLSEDARCRLVRRVTDARRVPARRLRVRAAGAAMLAAGLAVVAMVGLQTEGSNGALSDGEVAGLSMMSPEVVQIAVYWHHKELPVEVTGPSPRLVQGWFNRQLSFGLEVPDLGRGTHLLGGRMSHVGGREAALLVYEARGRKLTVLAFPVEAVGSDVAESLPRVFGELVWDNSGGLIVAAQQRHGVVYTYASTLAESEFRRVVESAQESLSARSIP